MTVVPAVVLTDVYVSYPGPPPVEALRGLNLQIELGEYVAIVGASGSGKSTLLNILGLLNRPTAGEYALSGRKTHGLSEVQRAALRGRKIGFVFQSFHLLEHRTVAENVMLAMIYNGSTASRAERLLRAHDLLGRVGLAHRINAVPATLSGGERQRVAIARALINQPSLLLCDEPTGNLDTANASRVLDLIEEVQRGGQTVVVITHDPVVADRAERRVVIQDGRTSVDRPSRVVLSP